MKGAFINTFLTSSRKYIAFVPNIQVYHSQESQQKNIERILRGGEEI